jgi:hypothetical protein
MGEKAPARDMAALVLRQVLEGGGMSRGFWVVRRPVWVVGGLAVAVVVMTVWLLRAKSGGNTATVLSLTVSIVSLAVAVRGLVPGAPASRVARDLADRVAQERGRARQQALGMSGTPSRQIWASGRRFRVRSRNWCAGVPTVAPCAAH